MLDSPALDFDPTFLQMSLIIAGFVIAAFSLTRVVDALHSVNGLTPVIFGLVPATLGLVAFTIGSQARFGGLAFLCGVVLIVVAIAGSLAPR